MTDVSVCRMGDRGKIEGYKRKKDRGDIGTRKTKRDKIGIRTY